jgi:phi13 family phage major tail protein
MPSEYGELTGLDNLHYAQVLADNESSYQTGPNNFLSKAAEMKKEAKVDVAIRYYDNKPTFSSPSEASTDVTLTVSGVPTRLAAELAGKPYDQTRGIMIDTGDVSNAPYCALSARGSLGDGGYRFYQFLKGKFSLGAETAKTKEEKVTASTVELTYTGLVTTHEFAIPGGTKSGTKGIQADTTDPAFLGADAWFSQVQTPETLGKPGVLTMASTPVDKATGVGESVKPVLTFSNSLAADAVTIVKADGTLVAADKSYDSTGKILTITPSAALTSGATYSIIVAGVADVFGQSLDTTAIKFTVA